MLLNTPAIVLHPMPYGETSVIVKIFTRMLGLRSYIIRGVRSASGRTKQNLLQGGACVDLVVYHNPKNTINYIKEIHPLEGWKSLDIEPTKMAVRFFITELLFRTLHDDEPDTELFDFVLDYLHKLDADDLPTRDFPILFTLRLSRFLGIEPHDDYSSSTPCFNPIEGHFEAPSSPHALLPYDVSHLLHYYLSSLTSDTSIPHPYSLEFEPTASAAETPVNIPLDQRTSLLNHLIDYYQAHLSSFGTFHSHHILHTVLSPTPSPLSANTSPQYR